MDQLTDNDRQAGKHVADGCEAKEQIVLRDPKKWCQFQTFPTANYSVFLLNNAQT